MEINDIFSLLKDSAGICTDTRTLKKNEVFFALKGPNHDGNQHAFKAIAEGARAAVVDDPSLLGDNIIVVDDVFATINKLAEMKRDIFKIPVLAITGTNGKTTTKELLRSVLSKKYRVHATEGNLNNHIGVPLTLLKAPEDTEMLIVEMGANHPGEIASLCRVARPTFGIITNIGRAHLEGFGSFGGVIAAKSELYHYLRDTGGIAIYNEMDTLLSELIFKIVHKAIPYSDPSGTDLMVTAVDEDVFLKVQIDYHGENKMFSTNLFGKHNLDNVRAAVATGIFFNVPLNDIAGAISSYKPQNNRSQILNTGKNMLVCDSYNANPSSMLKAISSFNDLKCEQKMVILGDMLELGEESRSEHERVLEGLTRFGIKEALLCGPVFSNVKPDLNYIRFKSVNELIEWLRNHKLKGKVILVKGSRGMALDKIYDLL